VVVEKSTFPVRTAEAVGVILSEPQVSGPTFAVLSNSEFLAKGTATADLKQPDRVLIGGEDPVATLLNRGPCGAALATALRMAPVGSPPWIGPPWQR
jgi:hypothetical protein